MTKRTTELTSGDVVVDANGKIMMTVRKVRQAVDAGYQVVWFFGPRGGAKRDGFRNEAEWMVRA